MPVPPPAEPEDAGARPGRSAPGTSAPGSAVSGSGEPSSGVPGSGVPGGNAPTAAAVAARVARHARPAAVEVSALRNRSRAAWAVLAAGATSGAMDLEGLVAAVDAGREVPVEKAWAVSLARALALQPRDERDVRAAAALLGRYPDAAARDLTYPTVLVSLGRHEDAARHLRTHGRGGLDERLLGLDLVNPWLVPTGDAAGWAAGFAEVFADHGLAPVQVADGEAPPFDRLTCPAPARSVAGPLVTVVMATYRPGPELALSVRSILDQTWADLEIILVDDASGPEYAERFAEIERSDERVRVVHQPRNMGTYAARNTALELARGELVTTQDDDDWAHPERIERQVRPLLEDEELPATLSRALWASTELQLTGPGRPSLGKYAPSFLVRRSVLREAGAYLPARKAADTEMIRRVAAATGRDALSLDLPLTVYRLRSGSLSRSDFTPGFDHPARVAFWEAAGAVHARIRSGRLRAAAATERVAVPHRYRLEPTPRRYDVVVVADWSADGRQAGGAYRYELQAMAESGLRVGLVHWEDLRHPQRRRRPVAPDVTALVNAGTVDQVFLDDDVHATSVLVRNAGLLLLPPGTESTLRCDHLFVVCDEPAVESAWWSPGECSEVARAMFGRDAEWVPENPIVRATLGTTTPATDHLTAVDPDRFAPPRSGRRISAGRPVVGRSLAFWRTEEDIASVTRLVGRGVRDLRVRVERPLEDGAPERGVGAKTVVYSSDDVAEHLFLRQLDCYVLHPVTLGEETAAVYRALAQACPVVLTQELPRGSGLGRAVLPVGPSKLGATLERLRQNPEEYAAWSAGAASYARRHLTGAAHLDRLRELGVVRHTEEAAAGSSPADGAGGTSRAGADVGR
ncbi:glycosyltransferase [Georgenia sp. 10Sc9-8]|uniref:Glycosyltransferase n=1 Tax=Georgenia halotolerans TaxID=3028317 RepID=A0ABT5TYW8_9MICO|nr:glycosyltransferase [Georgenia halotolerans]